jgi:hypothetical protein
MKNEGKRGSRDEEGGKGEMSDERKIGRRKGRQEE